jgi:hypothetical protein
LQKNEKWETKWKKKKPQELDEEIGSLERQRESNMGQLCLKHLIGTFLKAWAQGNKVEK